MSEAKFTPGPWATDDHVSHWSIMAEDGLRHVADVRKFGIGTGLQELPDGDANARLIAAAPDLLAACEAALSLLNNIGTGKWAQTPAGDTLRAAIAAARGPLA